SAGPTPVSLEMKPDVTAPGVNVISSLPQSTWAAWSGTSMASPHVAGAAAVLMQRHPTWTVEQIKSALESTGDPVHAPGSSNEVQATREGGGRIDLARADDPLVFTDPTGLSFGLVKAGSDAVHVRRVAKTHCALERTGDTMGAAGTSGGGHATGAVGGGCDGARAGASIVSAAGGGLGSGVA